jgi:CheY-like chemotaxis protein
MSIITVFAGTYCNEDQAVQEILNKTGYTLLNDASFVKRAASLSGLSESKIENAFSAKIPVFDKFTHSKERSFAYLKLAVARELSEHSDNVLIQGFSGLLIPEKISHVLRICLISDMKYRLQVASGSGMSEHDALKKIHADDEHKIVWIKSIFQKTDPWDPSLYDMVLPTDKMSPEEISSLVSDMLQKDILKASEHTNKTIQDFLLAAQVTVALAEKGHFVDAKADAGKLTIIINKHVLMLKRLEQELQSMALKVPGVSSAETKVGKQFYQADVYRKYDLEMPSKLLLVDDERQFAQTLSERLKLREIGSVIAYDGATALEMVKEDEPDVMILDLKMPGIDGLEVLKRVKQTNPKIEVIILTGHGTEADKELCMKIGAFAYLEKPVDVNILSETIKKANEKIRHGRENA